jgi:hypothetical protein
MVKNIQATRGEFRVSLFLFSPHCLTFCLPVLVGNKVEKGCNELRGKMKFSQIFSFSRRKFFRSNTQLSRYVCHELKKALLVKIYFVSAFLSLSSPKQAA